MPQTKFLFFIIISLAFSFCKSFGQTSDSTNNYQYDEVIVIADRFESKLFSSTSSTLKFNSQSISKLPANNGVELLKYIPGFNIASSTGLSSSPIVTSRGFFGGGEAEYLALFIDDIQINDVETGLIDWSILSNRFFNNIELSKGGSSSLYGDFALGGVVDIQTFGSEDATNIAVGGGTYNTQKFDLLSTNTFSSGRFNIFGNYFKTDGFREHNNSSNYSLGGNFIYNIDKNSTIRFTTINNYNFEELPGAITDDDEFDYYSSEPYYKFDENDVTKLRFNLGYDYALNQNNKLTFDLNYINKNSSKIRTFTNNTPIIDPTTFEPIGVYDTTLYGDTKNSELKTNVLQGRINYFINIPEISAKAIAGVEYQQSKYNNKTFDLFHGFEEDYNSIDTYSANEVVGGSGTRNKLATFINFKNELAENLYINIGLRYDYLNDKYNGVLPDTSLNIPNDAFSPKIGISFQYASSNSYNGSVYGNVNRAFKAPTVEQLLDFDELNFGIFIPIGPSDFIFQNIKASPFGNSLLKSQTSTNVELGTYQELLLSSEVSFKFDGAFYFSKIKNEIDFDLQTFKYENINDSKHLGIELGLSTQISKFNAFVNYAYTKAESLEDGMNGIQLKGIPKNVLSFGVSYLFEFGLNVALASNSVTEQYLDDTNENRLPDYTTWDGIVSYQYDFAYISLAIKNIFDKQYYTMGYTIDGTNYFYPMAERNAIIEVGIKF